LKKLFTSKITRYTKENLDEVKALQRKLNPSDAESPPHATKNSPKVKNDASLNNFFI